MVATKLEILQLSFWISIANGPVEPSVLFFGRLLLSCIACDHLNGSCDNNNGNRRHFTPELSQYNMNSSWAICSFRYIGFLHT